MRGKNQQDLEDKNHFWSKQQRAFNFTGLFGGFYKVVESF
jgi:hypothetical protein